MVLEAYDFMCYIPCAFDRSSEVKSSFSGLNASLGNFFTLLIGKMSVPKNSLLMCMSKLK